MAREASAAPVPAPTGTPVVSPSVAITAVSLEQRFVTQVKPLLAQYCYKCHANGKHKGDLSLDPYISLVSVQRDRKLWHHIVDELNQKLMPPDDKPQPKAEELAALLGWVNDALNYCDCTGPRNPGRVPIHRLNRTEYNNTVRDLFALPLNSDFHPADDFPNDDSGYGFDNIADVLTMSPLLAEKYLSAAETVLDKVIPEGNPNAAKAKRHNNLDAEGEGNTGGDLQKNGAAFVQHEFVADGTYEIRVRAGQDKFGDEAAKMVLRLDGKDLKYVRRQRTPLQAAGLHVPHRGKGRQAQGGGRVHEQRGGPEEQGPQEARGTGTCTSITSRSKGRSGPRRPRHRMAYKRIFFVTPGPGLSEDAAAKQVLEKFTGRAFRRPATAEEVASAFASLPRRPHGRREGIRARVKIALSAVLVSPHFLYRIEIDPPAAAPGRSTGSAITNWPRG